MTYYSHNQKNEIIYRLLLSRAIIGPSFKFIPYMEVEIAEGECSIPPLHTKVNEEYKYCAFQQNIFAKSVGLFLGGFVEMLEGIINN